MVFRIITIYNCSLRSIKVQAVKRDILLDRGFPMARIPKAEIERLKSEVSVERLGGGEGDPAGAARGGHDRAVPVP